NYTSCRRLHSRWSELWPAVAAAACACGAHAACRWLSCPLGGVVVGSSTRALRQYYARATIWMRGSCTRRARCGGCSGTRPSLAHLLLLVSDNTIRLYNIALKSGPKVVKVISIGPKPASILAGRTILDSLGDTAVDFTPTPDAEYLLILRGNGDVYMMPSAIEGKSHTPTPVRGPLPMYPPADDNYGSESCAITAMGGVAGSPALVVVATCSAELYHCLLLPN
ncbi:hypothetical protein ACJJTC_010950, partial [Scirpophaga incertulas]